MSKGGNCEKDDKVDEGCKLTVSSFWLKHFLVTIKRNLQFVKKKQKHHNYSLHLPKESGKEIQIVIWNIICCVISQGIIRVYEVI